ncbi:MAG: DUF4340 domain-containing protein [Planctomycetota bacterium]|jgi:hypothetical protein|nr:DUF4340 domain-containing protein [Planctomycetota bacterium]
MRIKTIAGLAILALILAQIIHEVKRRSEKNATIPAVTIEIPDSPDVDGRVPEIHAGTVERVAPMGGDSETRPMEPESRIGQPESPAWSGDEIRRLTVSDSAGKVWLDVRRENGNWRLTSLLDAPADSAKILRFLNRLRTAEQRPIPEEEATAGFTSGEGLIIQLFQEDGAGVFRLEFGLRPIRDYRSVYARRDLASSVFRLDCDIRGELGLWDNHSEARPDGRPWLKTRLFDQDPEGLTSLELALPAPLAGENGVVAEEGLPGHLFRIERDVSGKWRPIEGFAGDFREWREEAFAAWLADLSKIHSDGVAYGIPVDPASRFSCAWETTSGERTEMDLFQAGDDFWARLISRPYLFFHLPEWQTKRLAGRLEEIFKK